MAGDGSFLSGGEDQATPSFDHPQDSEPVQCAWDLSGNGQADRSRPYSDHQHAGLLATLDSSPGLEATLEEIFPGGRSLVTISGAAARMALAETLKAMGRAPIVHLDPPPECQATGSAPLDLPQDVAAVLLRLERRPWNQWRFLTRTRTDLHAKKIPLILDVSRALDLAVADAHLEGDGDPWHELSNLARLGDILVGDLTRNFPLRQGGFITTADTALFDGLLAFCSMQGLGMNNLDRRLAAQVLKDRSGLVCAAQNRAVARDQILKVLRSEGMTVFPLANHGVGIEVASLRDLAATEDPAEAQGWLLTRTEIHLDIGCNRRARSWLRLELPLGLGQDHLDDICQRLRRLSKARAGTLRNGNSKANLFKTGKTESLLTIPDEDQGANEVAASLPLSAAQKGIWVDHALSPENRVYHLPVAFRLNHQPDRDLWHRAINAVVARHPALRTLFRFRGETLESVVKHRLTIPLERFTHTADLETRLEKFTRKAFSLEEGPLLRAALVEGPEPMVFFAIHHLVFDGLSLNTMAAELAEAYSAFANDQPWQADPLPTNYADYVAAEQEWLKGEEAQRQWNYWRDKLSSPLPVLELPLVFSRPATRAEARQRISLDLGHELMTAVQTLASGRRVSRFMVLLGVWQTLLSAFSSQRDIIVGTPVAGRFDDRFAGVMGYFVNMVCLRADLSGGSAFATLLEQLRTTVLEAFDHADLPFAELVSRLGVEREANRTPVFQSAFFYHSQVSQDLTQTRTRGDGLHLSLLPEYQQTGEFDLALEMIDHGTSARAWIKFSETLFRPVTIERMANHFLDLLRQVSRNPNLRLGELWTGKAERRQLLHDWNRYPSPDHQSQESGLLDRFNQWVQHYPERMAVIGSDRRCTYSELAREANQLAHHLRALGAGPGTVIALAVERSPAMVAALLAIMQTGAAYLPIDPGFPADRIAYMLTDAACPLLVTQAHLSFASDHGARTVLLDRDHNQISAQPTTRLPQKSPPPEACAYLIYTSGSTGRPKGVTIGHGSLINFLDSMSRQPGLTPEDCLLSVTTLSFDIAGLELFGPLITGGRLVIAGKTMQTDALALAQTIGEEEVSVMQATPATWRLLQAIDWQGSGTVKILCGGEALPPDLALWLTSVSPSVWNMYGPTETTIWSAIHQVSPEDSGQAIKAVPVGRPIDLTNLYILDRAGDPVPRGVAGELWIGGQGLAQGYHRRPGLTADRFLPCPFVTETGARMYRTGDLVRYRSDGAVLFLGRLDHQVKVRGFRIELGEIEAALGQIEGIRELAVIPQEIRPGHHQLLAYIRKGPEPLSERQLRQNLATTLPDYMIPAVFVFLDALPLTPNGKVDRKALAGQARPVPAAKRFVSPRNPTEAELSALWSELLGLPRVGIHDDFFGLGGDSILSIQMVAKARQSGLGILPSDLFRHPTIALLAEHLSLGDPISEDGAVPLTNNINPFELVPPEQVRLLRDQVTDLEDLYPLSPLQQGLAFLTNTNPGNRAYHMQVCFRIRGEFTPAHWRKAWEDALGRHDSLRSHILPLDGRPHTSIRSKVNLPWQFIEAHQAEDREEFLKDFLERDVSNSFQIEQSPLFRLALIQWDAADHHFVFSNHHLLLDGWSLANLFGEVLAGYRAYAGGEVPSYGETLAYRNHIGHLLAQDRETAANYWSAYLNGLKAVTPLPKGDQPANQELGNLQMALDPERVNQWTTTARSQGFTLNTIVHGAWSLLLRRFSGLRDLVFGTTHSGRDTGLEGAEAMVGMLIHTLPLRINTDQRVRDMLAQIQASIAETARHACLSLGEIQSLAGLPGGEPLFESLVVFENYPVDPALFAGEAFAMEDVWAEDRIHYPLSLVFMPGDQPRLKLNYEASRYSGTRARELVDAFLLTLDLMLENLDTVPDPWTVTEQQAENAVKASLEKKQVTAPSTPLERELLAIWLEVLTRESIQGRLLVSSQVGIHQHFFEIGGHSLLATQVVNRIRETLHLDISVQDMFAAPTIAQLSVLLSQRGEEAPLPVKATVNPNQPFPLSSAQYRIWFLELLEGPSATYNITGAMRFRGELNTRALGTAFDYLINRHQTLRTVIESENGPPIQRVLPAAPFQLPVIDLREVADSENKARHQAEAHAAKAFDLTEAPLLRATLWQLTERDWLLSVILHHLVADGWSLSLLVDELKQSYNALCQGRQPRLNSLSVQYRDHVLWQSDQTQSRERERQTDYWCRRLAGTAACLALPLDFPRPAKQRNRGDQLSFRLDPSTTFALEALAQSRDMTMAMLMQAAFALLMGRYANTDDVVMGTPVANRPRRALEGLIGLFVNTLVLRSDLSGDPALFDYLARVRSSFQEAWAHQDLPFEDLIDVLQPERDMSHAPVFQVFFVHMQAPPRRFRMRGLDVELVNLRNRTAKFDISLYLLQWPDHLEVNLEYNSDLFLRTTVARLAGHYTHLLKSIVEKPRQRLSQFSFLPTEEQQQILEDWRGPELVLKDQELTVVQRCAGAAVAHPQKVAVIGAGMRLTYGELEARANQLARHLRAMGAQRGQLVGLALDRKPDLVVTLLAILKTGAAYVPVDPGFPEERIAYIMKDARCPLVVTKAALGLALPDGTKTVRLDQDSQAIAAQPAIALEERIPYQALAYVIYTSGSTGKPKGVAVTHGNLANFLASMSHQPGISLEDRWLSVTTISFDIAGLEIFGPLVMGSQIVLADDQQQNDAGALACLLEEEKITVMQATPATWRLLEAANWRGNPDLTCLCGGESLPPDLAHWLTGVTGSLWNMYGPTETTVWSTIQQLKKDGGQIQVSIGRPIHNTAVFLLDPQLNLVPEGVAGDLWIGGAGLARGYHQRPGLTAARFVPCPFAAELGARMYRTGDLASSRNNGILHHLGRSDHQVKVRGFRIELGEVETALGEFPGIQAQVVLALPGPDGQQVLAAFLQADDEAPSEEAIRNRLVNRLPDYMVPVSFIFLKNLPLTPNGKIDRKALTAGKDFEVCRENHSSQDYAPPETPLQQSLSDLWHDLLKVDAGKETQRLGIHQDFFKCGGNSLLATRLVNRIREQLGLELAIREVFAAPTMAQMAQVLETTHPPADPPMVPVPRTGDPLPLSFAQERLWFLQGLFTSEAAKAGTYNICGGVHLSGPLDIEKLELAFAAVVQRHEVLRTTFHEQGDRAVQTIHLHSPVVLRLIDLSGHPDPLNLAQSIAAQKASHAFDLSRLPLFQVSLLHLATREHILLVTLHHIVADAWSLDLLIAELGRAYRGEDATGLDLQNADFSVWQRETAERGVLDQQIAWWRQQLADLPEHHGLPVDRPLEPGLHHPGGRWQQPIDETTAAQVTACAKQWGITPFTLLLAVFKVLLYRYSSRSEQVVGTPVSGRVREEIEPLIGCFVNTLVLRTAVKGLARPAEVLAEVRETVVAALAHQDAPFALVVDAVNPSRNQSTPLFQIMFTYRDEPPHLDLPHIQAKPFSTQPQNAKFELTFECVAGEEGLWTEWEYDRERFQPATIQRMADHFQRLLKAFLNQPNTPVRDLPMAAREEIQRALDQAAGSLPELPSHNIHQLVARTAANQPDAVAIASGPVRLTYAELNRRADSLAEILCQRGLQPGNAVGLTATRSPEAICAQLAILKAGGTYVPLDPSLPRERLEQMIAETGAALICCHQDTRAIFEPYGHPILDLDQPALWSESKTAEPVSVSPEHAAYVMFTSGSTGQPKGVVIPHQAVVRLVAAPDYLDLDEGDRVLCCAPLSFDAATFEIWGTLAKGACICLYPDGMPDLEQLAQFLKHNQVSTAFLTSGLFNGLVDQGLVSGTHLRYLLTGGEALSVAHAQSFLDTFPECRLIHVYGPTENTTFSTFHRLTPADMADWPPIGTAIAHTTAHVVDEQGRIAPTGTLGELVLGGLGLARGYLERPALTAERFVPDPHGQVPGGRLYRSGDLVTRNPGGQLLFRGRRDGQVKIRGFRIETGEIEAQLRLHPTVEAVAVVVREDGPGGRGLVAFVQASDTCEPTSLRNFSKAHLPSYMCPAHFVILSSLPLNANGKIDRKALAHITLTKTRSNLNFPRNNLEQQISNIWIEILCLDEVDIFDNFFDIGGHSLLATRVVTRVRNILNEFSLGLFFKEPTIAGMASAIACLKQVAGTGSITVDADEEREEFAF